MEMIEVDRDVSRKLAELAEQMGVTRNEVIRRLLKLDYQLVSPNKRSDSKLSVKNVLKSEDGIKQENLIDYIIKILYEKGGKATKKVVENEIYQLFKNQFEGQYYQQKVAHGVPRWKHYIAWAKERAKHEGYVKSPKESGLGIWELTQKGIDYIEKRL